MAGSPKWKVYDAAGQYVASCKEPEAGAVLVSFYGNGSTIRSGHSKSQIVWIEGSETLPASQSYDNVAITCFTRADLMSARMNEQRIRDAEHAKGAHERRLRALGLVDPLAASSAE